MAVDQKVGKQFEKREITKKSQDISGWYNDVVLKAKLADYGPVRGTMILRPYGYAIWEKVVEILDKKFKADGVQNAYFPLFIPLGFLQKEKKHIEGFSPELAVVTHGGGEKLAEPVVVRPTSETVMYEAYSRWISSHRDLPLKINQWNNVVRWEKRTYLFMRTSEFLWQEGHTAHATDKEADDMARKALDWYKSFYEEYFAIPTMVGTKSPAERFAGAKNTYTVELLMPDGRALQGATSHNLTDNFAKPFKVQFQDEKGETRFVHQTSWGLSWRSLGALTLVHGDDNGLVLPPEVAPTQVVIIPVITKDDKGVLGYAQRIASGLGGLRVEIDDSDNTAGWKFNEWELRGVSLRIEVGEKEMAEESVTLVRRDTGEKLKARAAGIASGDAGQNLKLKTEVETLLEDIQNSLFQKAKRFLEDNTHEIETYEEFKKIMETGRGFIWAFWCENPECEAKIKQETKATTRLLPLDAKKEDGKCIYCGDKAVHRWLFAQAY